MAIDEITYTSQCVKYNGITPSIDPPPSTMEMTKTESIEILTTTPNTVLITTTTYAECAQYICYNEGICISSSTPGGKPICKSGFNGPRRENKESSSNKSNLGAILGEVFGVLAAIALLLLDIVAIASTQLVDSLPKGSTKNPAYSQTEIIDT
ncbi:unnamed protein product [Rotaria sp. Silwood2]|nr:unnamed protein product [Rotaria sp. Silwood2]CAF2994597.1 unnamed protein product [Rotaria sp. Silwood2]CAF3215088.1 unnamed protein product [Rotaria sp. Silwood2]CAF4416651.1 unnamed protein product [Rotaria sp. Silwood2]CAF4495295.1 unnamed protein product [Rotaria sp. Silwood2]